MARRFLSSAGLMMAMIIVLAGCGGGIGPAEPTPMGTPVEAGQSIILTPEAQMAGVLRRDDEIHIYRFNGTADEAVTVDMYAPPAGNLDTYLALIGPDGTELTNDDDGGNSSDSRIESFVLPVDGEYQIKAQSYRTNTRGGYSLVIDLGTPLPRPTATATVPPGGGAITLYETRPGGINTPGQVDLWEFDGEKNDLITIDMRRASAGADELDPYLVLLDAGKTLVEDDDSGSDLDARIANFRLPHSGRYVIQASAVRETVGNYLLVVSPGVAPTAIPPTPTPGPSPTPVHAVITLGSETDAAIRAYSDGNFHTLTIDSPTTVEIVVLPEYDVHGLYLDMTGPDGVSRDLEDYRSANLNQQVPYIYIPGLMLPEPGEYVFHVRSRMDAPLNYTFSVQTASDALPVGGGLLRYGQSASGAIQYANDEDRWTFEGQPGDVITISMHGDDTLESYLMLLGPDGQELITADNRQYNSSGAQNVEIANYRLPTGGTYTIVALGALRRSSVGQYRLLLFKIDE